MSGWLRLVCEGWAVRWGKAVAVEGRTKELGGKELEKAHTQAVFMLFAFCFPLLSLIIKEKSVKGTARHSPAVRTSGEGTPGALCKALVT